MTPAPNRRWFRWSLRTTFVVVTVTACWLGQQINAVHRRRAVIDSMDHNGVFLSEPKPGFDGFGNIAIRWTCQREAPQLPPQISWIRSLLGDVAIGGVYVEEPRRAAELAAMFPEAGIFIARLDSR